MTLFTPRVKKAAACLFLSILTFNILCPVATYALTSGPTQPESTSFEPIDTTDMVNLQTGDFTYSIPLVDVPGPEGGYPLALSYHAGVQPNTDASWVGLGWTLNPGAISRTVNGYPDDWKGAQSMSRQWWSGETVNTFSVGVNIGIANSPLNASVGLSISDDNLKGFSVSGGLKLGESYGGFNASGGVGFGPVNGVNSLSMSYQGLSVNQTGGVTSASYMAPAMGAVMSSLPSTSNNGTYNIPIGPLDVTYTNSSSSKNGIQSRTTGLGVKFFFAKLGYNHTRYFTDETSSYAYNGAANPGGGNVPDAYSIVQSPGEVWPQKNSDPGMLQGGSFLAYDDYEVSAQGLNGQMRPYVLQSVPAEQLRYLNGNLQINYNTNGHYQNGGFRFVDDFSNCYTQAYSDYTNVNEDIFNNLPPLDGSPQYGTLGANYNMLPGSRHVDVGTQLLPVGTLGYDPNEMAYQGEINGFAITNESGVTYHYSLPEFTWSEQIYSQNMNAPGSSVEFNRQTKGVPYIYSWLLTSITGPDYVDRNNDHKADAGDWGYWVNFEYGKWSDSYYWRNPSTGYSRDMDNGFENCSMGVKQVYYLNAIQTRTHTALFEKNVRYDAKGEANSILNTQANNGPYLNTNGVGSFDGTSSQSLRLDKIYILNTADAANVSPLAGSTTGYIPPSRQSLSPDGYEMPANVLDAADINAYGRSTLESKALRIIDFYYDYSLCNNTTNSFDYSNPSITYGKLTLNTLAIRGQGGVSVMPPTKFGYDLAPEDQVTASGSLTTTSFASSSATQTFNVGDLLVTNDASANFCGVVTGVTNTAGNYTYTLANNNNAISSVSLRTTKDPPYNAEFYDMWGMYKSDFDLTSTYSSNSNLIRNASPVSAAGMDAWSLRTITTPLGGKIKIKYQPDDFSTSVLNNTNDYIMSSPSFENGTLNQIKFQVNTEGYNPSSIFPTGTQGILLLGVQYSGPSFGTHFCYSGWTQYTVNQPIDAQGYVHVTLATPVTSVVCYATAGTNAIPVLLTGNITVGNNITQYGGNLRVASIGTTDEAGRVFTRSYGYANPTTGVSSGETSYLPRVLDDYDRTQVPAGADYISVLYSPEIQTTRLSVVAPPPGVLYQYVTVTSQVQNPDESQPRVMPGKTVYQFDVFQPSMIQMVDVTPIETGTYGQSPTSVRNYAMQVFASSVGNLVSVTQYDNNNQMLNSTVNHYLHDGMEQLAPADFMSQYRTKLANYSNQGYIQERVVEDKIAGGQYFVTYTSRESLPSIMTGQTMTDYVHGTQSSTQNIAFDFYSGAVTQSSTIDPYGNTFIKKIVPAYTIHPAMNLKAYNDNNKNMLSQVAETYEYNLNGTSPGYVLVNADLWTDSANVYDSLHVKHLQNGMTETVNGATVPNGDIWRHVASYSWQPDGTSSTGLKPTSSFVDINGQQSGLNPGWKLGEFTTLFDINSKELESVDGDGIYGSTKMGYNDSKVVLTGQNCKYSEIAFSGAEDENINKPSGSGFVTLGSNSNILSGTMPSGITGGSPVPVAHTGNYGVYMQPSGGQGFVYSVPTDSLNSNIDYMASVWVINADGPPPYNAYLNYTVGSTSVNSAAMSLNPKHDGNWVLLTLKIHGSDLIPHQTLTVSCNNGSTYRVASDDFRFQPINASTTAYVYDPVNWLLKYTLDNNNMYVRYAYDTEGRLIGVYVEKLNVGEIQSQSFQYNYGQPVYVP